MTTNSQNSPTIEPTEQSQLVPTRYLVIGGIVALLLAVGTIAAILWLANTQAPTLEALRDVFIIALALEACLFGVVLMVLLVMVIRLVNMLEFEIKPILQKTNETISTLQGTTNFIGENVVKPVAKARGSLAGARRTLAVLFGDPRRNLPDDIDL